ncbi:MAG: Do family serine endopeptidase [Rhodospirillaceae bacterium]|jgi:Do/DeqQ family serine protease|nr:Do family serine endopeptidase [Rhodospirillaceae bacterium]MBT5944039.1 Do family serine endopeptidase [Rhodospirillaceae bacterium]MBT6404192.1 Do family serine endopeptidase [Rhodospirillaceae bacterium]MBT6535640.1 Do family serine endopeptidase [Rhodospirillaceae bacterium]MBT7361518.1 Do family serine endopeptidase [Rhodospirillaceae bacterium]
MRTTRQIFTGLILLAIALLPAGVTQAQRAIPDNRVQVMLSFAPLVREASPAVVNVFTRKAVRSRGPASPLFNDPFFRRFFGDALGAARPRERIENSLGSGVIVRPDGLIVTNFHVIEGADSITVVLSDRREFDATILREDERTDLAILKIDAGEEELPSIALSDSDDLEVGDLVLAIGNPFGVGKTVTSGIVSGLARTQVGISDFNFFIQTDAAINPGNSGGALLRMDGTLAGINTAIFSRSGGSQGIGFAIPANMVRTVIDGAAAGAALRRAWLGASFETVTADIAEAIGLPHPEGVILSGIHAQGPAVRAGLQSGDIITAFNGQPVFDTEGLRFRIATGIVGDEAQLSVRRPKSEHEITLVLELPPEVPLRNERILEGRHPIAGATVANLSPAVAEEMGRDHFEEGVVVRAIASGSPAHRLSFQIGDVIFAVNEVEVKSVVHVRELTASPAPQWTITVRRDGRLFSLTVAG